MFNIVYRIENPNDEKYFRTEQIEEYVDIVEWLKERNANSGIILSDQEEAEAICSLWNEAVKLMK